MSTYVWDTHYDLIIFNSLDYKTQHLYSALFFIIPTPLILYQIKTAWRFQY